MDAWKLEDDCFLLGPGLFSGAMFVSGTVVYFNKVAFGYVYSFHGTRRWARCLRWNGNSWRINVSSDILLYPTKIEWNRQVAMGRSGWKMETRRKVLSCMYLDLIQLSWDPVCPKLDCFFSVFIIYCILSIHCAGNGVSQQALCYVSFPKFTCWFTRACNGVLLSTCHRKSTSPHGQLPSGHVGHWREHTFGSQILNVSSVCAYIYIYYNTYMRVV